MTNTKTDWYIIVNPRAGSGKTMSRWIPAERKLLELGIEFTTAMTDHKRHATMLAHEAAAAGYRKFLSVGGDGSLHETLIGIARYCDESGVPSEDFTLGVMPIGSGNDWIKSLGVPNDLYTVANLIAKGSFGKMDLVRVAGGGEKTSYMANVGGTGFDSHVCSRVNFQKESGRRGKLIYLYALLHTVRNLGAISLKVIADGKEVFEGPCYSVALGNGPFSGSGMRQVPSASIDDGILDYMIVPKLPVRLIVSQIPRLFNGTVDKSPHVISGKCRELLIAPMDEASEDIFELDGEIEGRLPLSIRMDGRQINVIKGSAGTEP